MQGRLPQRDDLVFDELQPTMIRRSLPRYLVNLFRQEWEFIARAKRRHDFIEINQLERVPQAMVLRLNKRHKMFGECLG